MNMDTMVTMDITPLTAAHEACLW